MALKLSTPPAGGVETVRNSIHRLSAIRPPTQDDSGGGAEVMARLAGVPDVARDVRVVDPQKVYQITLTQLGTENPLDNAEPVAWRYLISSDDEAVSAAETTLGGGEPPRF